jgi:hypothetical protein
MHSIADLVLRCLDNHLLQVWPTAALAGRLWLASHLWQMKRLTQKALQQQQQQQQMSLCLSCQQVRQRQGKPQRVCTYV